MHNRAGQGSFCFGAGVASPCRFLYGQDRIWVLLTHLVCVCYNFFDKVKYEYG